MGCCNCRGCRAGFPLVAEFANEPVDVRENRAQVIAIMPPTAHRPVVERSAHRVAARCGNETSLSAALVAKYLGVPWLANEIQNAVHRCFGVADEILVAVLEELRWHDLAIMTPEVHDGGVKAGCAVKLEEVDHGGVLLEFLDIAAEADISGVAKRYDDPSGRKYPGDQPEIDDVERILVD